MQPTTSIMGDCGAAGATAALTTACGSNGAGGAAEPAEATDERVEDAKADAGEQGVEEDPVAELEFSAEIVKTDKGLGIYFARDGESGALAVDGFVEGVGEDRGDDGAGLARLRVGDVLTQINGVECSQLEVAEVVALLRSAPPGVNTLRFRRPAVVARSQKEKEKQEEVEEEEAEDPSERSGKEGGGGGSLAGSFIGALRKVKSRMTAEMAEEAKREQEAAERFEKQWLAEFDRFKAAHEVRWETCTYSADEFCGHLYRGSDAQQRARLEREYPTLMEAWKECQDLPDALPQWPSAKLSADATVAYAGPTPSAPTDAGADGLVREVECAPALRLALEFLRHEFMWRPCHVDALGRRLEALGIGSCAELARAAEAGARGELFERQLQSPAFPRLTKALCRALRSRAEQAAASRGVASGADFLALL